MNKRLTWIVSVMGAFLLALPGLGQIVATRDDAERRLRPDALDAEVSSAGHRSELGVAQRYARGTYIWPYDHGPHYGHVAPHEKRDAGTLHTRVGSFRLSASDLAFPAELTGTTEGKSSGHVIVQLDPHAMAGGAFDELSSAVAEASGSVVRALPVAAFVVRVDFAALPRLNALPGVLAVEPYHPALKLSPEIGRAPLIDPVQAVSEIYRLELRLFPGEDARRVAAEVETLGGSIRSVWPDTVVADVHRAKLVALARIEAVEWIVERLPNVPQAEEATTTVMTGRWNAGAMPYHAAGVDGGGGGLAAPQVMMFLDTGIQLDAADLSDTRTSPGVPGNDPSNADPSGDHRKIVRYESTDAFGGNGDLLGCDSAINGGFTHGQAVLSTALGNASDGLPVGYGSPSYAIDEHGRRWRLDGVAPGAKAAVFDGQVTPALGSCSDPLRDTIDPGDLYSGGSTGSLGGAYAGDVARVMTLAWGADANLYTADVADIDEFLADKRSAMVFVPAGNRGSESFGGVPATDTLSTLATSKNGLTIGAVGQADDHGAGALPDSRASFSGVGPTPGDRVAPQLMAPGNDFGDTGVNGATSCRSDDADQAGPVQCDVGTGQVGTSYATAAAAGAGALVRDWFAQGFYPDGTTSDAANPADIVPDVSGALLKAVLIDSARFLTGSGVTHAYRFNNEQGYGRIQLDRALTLQGWPSSPTGILVCDGGIDGGRCDLAGLTGDVDAVAGETDSTTFVVGDPRRELRVALAWLDASGQALVNDLDLELIAPSGRVYYGNFFTEDDDRDGSLDALAEDCPGFDGAAGSFDESPWSLPVCTRGDSGLPPRDAENPTEAVFLSPDPDGDGNFTDGKSQIELGTWTLRVVARAGGADAGQRYAVAIVGGVGDRSTVRLDRDRYTCADELVVTVNETDDPTDPVSGLDEAEIGLRIRVQVLSGETVVDEESGLTFTRVEAGGASFAAKLSATDVTAYDPGNGALDVRSGDTVRVIYDDETSGTTDSAKRVDSVADVDCRTRIGFRNLGFAQFGLDGGLLAAGGCERNARGQFEFGFPDSYLDAGESVILRFAFASEEDLDLEGVEVSLRCVDPDADSPADCTPGSDECPDPDRRNNTACNGNPADALSPAFVEALNSPLVVGALPSSSALSGNFNLRMASSIPGMPEVELVLEAKAGNAGRTVSGVAVSRQRLDVDEHSTFYSTDFPTGGSETFDYDNNELIENPTTNPYNFDLDYRFETRVYGDLTAGGTKNLALQSPWHFDLDDGGFRSGIGAATDHDTIGDTITQWGEDLNFNGLNDKRCTAPQEDLPCLSKTDCLNASPPASDCVSLEDRDPANGLITKNWSTSGGCGWQTAAPSSCALDPGGTFCYTDEDCIIGTLDAGPCNATPGQPAGGVWHTGRIGTTNAASCLVDGNATGQCQTFETVSGATGQRTWFELLMTPEIEKVNGPEHQAEITAFSWNAAIDLPDSNAFWTWEVDTDLDTLEPTDLVSDLTILNFSPGSWGPVENGGNFNLTDGFPVFAPVDNVTGQSENGSVGNDRVGKNSCFFESSSLSPNLGFAGPPDDDLNQGYCQGTLDNLSCQTAADCPPGLMCVFDNALVDEYVKPNGPLRNQTLQSFNGPDMRFANLADLFGPAGDRFQAGIGMINFEKRSPSNPDPASGFGVSIDDVVLEWREFELVDDQSDCAAGSCAVIDLATTNVYGDDSLLAISVIDTTPSPNDCNADGDNGDPGDDFDCDDDGTPDVVVELSSGAESDPGEFVLLEESDPGEYTGVVRLSAASDIDGVLLIGGDKNQTSATVEATYLDLDDGAGQPCSNTADPAFHGNVSKATSVFLRLVELKVSGLQILDNGDGDGWADTHETVEMKLNVFNTGNQDLTGVVAHIASDDSEIECLLDSRVEVGDLAAGESALSTGVARFKIGAVDRSDSGLGPNDALDVEFSVRLQADGFDAANEAQTISIALDLDAAGGGDPTTFFEGFEVASGLGSFTTMNLDFGYLDGDPLENSDGQRCQYMDPDWTNSNSYGSISDCFVGPTSSGVDAYYWQVTGPSDIDGGRAYNGTHSLYNGIFGPAADEHTTPLAALEATGSEQPIDLGASGASPELSITHQFSGIDWRTVGLPEDEGSYRGIVAAQLADGVGAPESDWIKIYPYVNVYDKFGTDNYTNCKFDPMDDGTTEDDFFEPNDPDRRLGPSSTCFPERNFNHIGDTFYPFDPQRLGGATGPGLEGSVGPGTWVESRFSLEQFRGRRIRLRFLTTGVKAGTFETHEQIFAHNPDPGDDGWWIDDITVTNALTAPVTLSVDDNPNTALPECGNTCNVATADLRTTPIAEPPITSLDTPGRAIELNAAGSFVDQCISGVLQYRFSSDIEGVLREYSGDPTILVAPTADTVYTVEVRCSSDALCSGFDNLAVAVDCPTSSKTIGFADKNSFIWEVGNVAQDAVFVQGEGRAEIAARAPSIVSTPTPTSSAGAHDVSGSTPAPYELEWWLIRTAGDPTPCNVTWSSGGAGEQAGRDAGLP
ncbi:MAG: S8 family serine peptidase [bacterium]|nr:S8 family serine peptidase [bacterium]